MNIWSTSKLKDVCDRVTVGFVGSMAHEYQEAGVPFLRSQNITPFRLHLEGLKYIDEKFHEKIRKSALRPGDVAVVRTGYPGTACVIPRELGIANCSDLVIIRPGKQLNPYFLCAIFNSTFGRDLVGGNLVGAAQQHFNITVAKELKFLLPPRPVQDKIAAILSAYDDLIENNRRRIALLEKMAEEIYLEWFVRMRFPGHEQAKFEKGVPEGWRVERVASLVDRKRFGRIYREGELLPEGTVVVIDQSTNEWLGFHEGKAEHEASPERPLILFGDHSCKMQLMIEPFSLAENVIPFSSKGEMPIIFLYYLVHSLVETTEYKRHWADLTTKQVFVPADTLQKQFDEKVKNLIVMSRQLKAVNAMLSKVRDQLLPRLISGKLDVENLDIQFPPSMLNEPSLTPSPQPSPGGRGSEAVAHA